MALRSTIYRADLSVSDLDRQVYGRHALTLARHPSETEERLMVRLVAFALHSDDALEFGRGLSAEGEPDLIRREKSAQGVRSRARGGRSRLWRATRGKLVERQRRRLPLLEEWHNASAKLR